MSTLTDALLESWTRQATIVSNLANLIDETSFNFVPAPNESSIGWHLSHISQVRTYWLSQVAPGSIDPSVNWGEVKNLSEAKEWLDRTAGQIADAMKELLNGDGAPSGGYDHPVYFLQHMIWHEGWHVGAIMMALRQNGQETPEEWEEPNIWGLWRTEIWE